MRLTRSWQSMSLVGIVVGALGTGGVTVLTAAHAASSGTVSSYASLPTQRLTGDVLPKLHKANDLGRTSKSTRVEVGLVLARPHAAAQAALARAIYTKGSPDYHHYLTPQEYSARFAVPSSAFSAVVGWASRDGLRVAHTTSMRDYVTLLGTARQAEKTFAVRLHDFRQAGSRFYANTKAPRVPADYGVTGVIGLNSRLKSTLPATTPAKTKQALRRGFVTRQSAVKPAQDTCNGPLCVGLTTPQDLWSVYDQPTDNYGQGQSMAIFGEGDYHNVVTNLRTFESLHGLPPIPLKVVETDGPNAKYDDNSGEVEWDLDTQSSTGMAPKALGETLYFGESLSDASVLDDFEAWVEDPTGPLQASASFGECEENPVGNGSNSGGYAFSAGTQFTLQSEAAFQQAVSEGRTLFSSTGDTGSSCPVVPVDVNGVGNEAFPVVNYPASSPEVVAVGGTVLYTDGKNAGNTGFNPSGASRVAEYSWNFTGGGSSVTFAQPDYQSKNSAPQPTVDCLDNPDGSTVSGPETCRGIPDIAAQSGDVPSNGYAIVAGGETSYPGGGTSLSSPLSLGMWTRINAAAPGVTANGTTTYPGLGFANEVYYADYAAHAGDFFDVGGGPSSPPNSNGYYVSAPGDDYLSGLGVPDVTKIAQHVDGGTAPAHNVLPSYPASGPNLNPCSATLFTDAKGDDAYIGDPNGSGSNPQLDIVSGNMTVNGSTLTTTLTINDLTKNQAQAAGAANDYYFLWSYGGTQYFSEAEVDSTTGAVTYGDGTISGTQYTTAHSDDTGSFNVGKNGTVVVNVPLANVTPTGGTTPASGSVLLAPAGQTRVLVGTTLTGGFIEEADSGGPLYDFQIGATCDPASPSPSSGVPVTTVSPTPLSSVTASPSGTFSLEPTPSPSQSSTATPTPTKTNKPSRDRTPPRVHVHHQHRTKHHRRRIVITIADGGSGIAKLVHVRLHHASWSLGKRRSRHFSPPRHKLRIIVTRSAHWNHGKIHFVAVDKAGNRTPVRVRTHKTS